MGKKNKVDSPVRYIESQSVDNRIRPPVIVVQQGCQVYDGNAMLKLIGELLLFPSPQILT